jgi:hypothetical protein
MPFTVDTDLLARSRAALSQHERLYWVVGGAGSGKTTICQALSATLGIPVYDMDAQIYGAYHGRFTRERHPVNCAWSTSSDGLAWLLDMSWDEFYGFNRAALPEYLDLLAEDLDQTGPDGGVLIDGGICNPAILAQVIPSRRVVCLVCSGRSSREIWEETDERSSMKEAIFLLRNPEDAWRRFLEFDGRITRTILRECQEHDIPVCVRDQAEPVKGFAERVAGVLGIPHRRH